MFVYATNQTKQDIKLVYLRRSITLVPKKRTPIPFELAAQTFGDPRTLLTRTEYKNEDGSIDILPSRREELVRLSIYWGTYEDGNPTLLGERIPNVALQDENGKPWVKIFDDPEALQPLEQTEIDNSQNGQVEKLRRQIAHLQATQVDSIDDDDDDIPVDKPTTSSALR